MHCIYFPHLSLNVQRVSEGIPLMEAEHTVIYFSLSLSLTPPFAGAIL